jgi:hypothetical protein
MSNGDTTLPDSGAYDEMHHKVQNTDPPIYQTSGIVPKHEQNSLQPLPPRHTSEPVLTANDYSRSVLLFPILNSIKKKKESQKNNRCKCFPQTKRGRVICVSTTVALLVIVICLLVFYIPRLPEFNVLYVQVRPVNGQLPLTISQNSNNPTDISLQLPIFMGVSVLNPNRYDLAVDTFSVTTYIQPNVTALKGSGLPGSLMTKTSNAKVGYGAYGSRNFPSYSNVSFEIQLLLDYTPDPKLGLLNDPAFGDLLQVCGIKSTFQNRSMTIKYDVGITISFLARLGIYPVLPNEVNIKCPLPPNRIDELTNRFKVGI